MKVPANTLKIADVIMPPPRELQLWMRRHVTENGLPESALHLTITEIIEGAPDARGPWLIIKADQSDAWNAGHPNPRPFIFKVRPATPWHKITA